jgi:hypothetical protein
MPFAVFRRHQRKMLAILAILAMIAFTMDIALTRNFRGGFRGGSDPVVVELYGRSVHRSELDQMRTQRARANLFLDQLFHLGGLPIFGDLSTRSLVDALILQHEADALGMPATPEMAKVWLEQQTGGTLDTARFDQIYRESFRNQVTDSQLLVDLANQIRLFQIRSLPGPPLVTPLDVFHAYRDQNERVSVQAVAVRVAEFLKQVPNPTEAEVRAFFDRSKGRLTDATSSAPGFLRPHQVQVESLGLDGTALEGRFRTELTEAELREAYELHKPDFALPALPRLPDDLFAGDPKASLTPPRKDAAAAPEPPRYRPLADVRPILEDDLVDDKVQAEVERLFEPIREAMQSYADAYYQYLDAIEQGTGAARPALPDLKKLAAGSPLLSYQRTPPLTREQAQEYAPISKARLGWAQTTSERIFAEVIFEPKAVLFEPIELSDAEGRRYLAWRIEDRPEKVPDLSEVRPQVVEAWKLEKARPLAKKAAEELAQKARAQDGQLKAAAGDRPVVVTPLQSKMQPGPILNQFRFGAPRASDLPDLPQAGEVLREAVFNLAPKAVAVAPNAPETVYYVVALNQRLPARFEALYAPYGPRMQFQSEASDEARTRRSEEWLALLRARAGLKPGWAPPDDTERETVPDEG